MIRVWIVRFQISFWCSTHQMFRVYHLVLPTSCILHKKHTYLLLFFLSNSLIYLVAGKMQHSGDKLMRWPDRGGVSGWMDAACEPPVGHYLHHCRCAIKMVLGKSSEGLYCRSLHILFEKYLLAWILYVSISNGLFNSQNMIVLSPVKSIDDNTIKLNLAETAAGKSRKMQAWCHCKTQ